MAGEVVLKLAGEAGQGVESSGAGFARALARGGLSVFGSQDYMSRIRGGHNFYLIRASAGEDLWAPPDRVHLLLAFDAESLTLHLDELVAGGGAIYDDTMKVDEEEFERRKVQAFPLPLARIAQEKGSNRLMVNTAALAAAAGIMDYDFAYVDSVIQDNFRRKGNAVVDANRKVAEAAYQEARRRYGDRFEWKLRPLTPLGQSPYLLLSGHQALALGALAGGCRFISAYPMTPASSIFEWMVAHANQYGIVAKQTEDEISAILMAIGAAHMGARAMTATSGGGFSLMVEALGMAGMMEEPVVIVLAQRPGPSTGMPTRTEQGDLLFALHASQGEFPRVLLAPGTVEEAFRLGAEAFNLAERYQLPVIILTDAFLANAVKTVERSALALSRVEIDRGELVTPAELDRMPEGEKYLRYRVTPSGVSPRALPGHPRAVYLGNSDEHTKAGAFEDEDPENRERMHSKRLRKLETVAKEIPGPFVYDNGASAGDGARHSEVVLIGWGSSYGPLREAVEELGRQGVAAKMVHLAYLWPFPVAKLEAILTPWLERGSLLVVVEGNATGQLRRLLRAETGIEAGARVLRYDGRPLTAGFILEKLAAVERRLLAVSRT